VKTSFPAACGRSCIDYYMILEVPSTYSIAESIAESIACLPDDLDTLNRPLHCYPRPFYSANFAVTTKYVISRNSRFLLYYRHRHRANSKRIFLRFPRNFFASSGAVGHQAARRGNMQAKHRFNDFTALFVNSNPLRILKV